MLERGRIGDPMTASFGRTRSFRNDYLDATYARLAHEAFRLWGAFELQTATKALVRCGCLNIAKRSVTPDLAETYAQRSHETLVRLGLRTASFDAAGLRRALRVPRRRPGAPRPRRRRGRPARRHRRAAGSARRARRAGPRGRRDDRRRARRRALARGHRRRPPHRAVARRHRRARHQRRARAAARLPPRRSRSPRTGRARRSTSSRPRTRAARFTAGAMPVIAYLDTGIYCHPIVDGLVDAVKIGYYNPPDMPREHHGDRQHRRASSSSACRACATRRSRDVEDVDQCDYDLVADDDFVLGAGPGVRRTRSSASAGGAPATSSRRGWAGCWPSSPSRAAPSTTSPASTRPVSLAERRRTDEPSVAADPAAASR